MRIAHLTPSYFSTDSVVGGGERYVDNLIKALGIVSAKHNKFIEQEIISVSDRPSVSLRGGIRTRLLKNLRQNHSPTEACPEGLRCIMNNYDVIHVHQFLSGFGEFVLPIIADSSAALIGTDHGAGTSKIVLTNKSMELYSAIISVSKYAQSLISIPKNVPSYAIIGPIDTGYYSPPQKKEISAAKDKFNILSVNRLLPHKGIDRIISALPQNASLTIAGTPYNEDYYCVLKNLSKGKSVNIITDASDEKVLSLYKSSDLFVQASTHIDFYGNFVAKPELMGLTTLEAMSCGLPALVSTTGSLPELVSDISPDWIFSDQKDLTEKLLEIISSKGSSCTGPESLRSHMVKHYSFDVVGKKILEIYASAFNRKRGA